MRREPSGLLYVYIEVSVIRKADSSEVRHTGRVAGLNGQGVDEQVKEDCVSAGGTR